MPVFTESESDAEESTEYSYGCPARGGKKGHLSEKDKTARGEWRA